MEAKRGLKNPVVAGFAIQSCVFVALMIVVILNARSTPGLTAMLLIVVAAPVTIVVIVSVGAGRARVMRRERLRRVIDLNPDATVVRTEWSSALLAPFVEPVDSAGSSRGFGVGFGVEVVADGAGLSLWRSRGARDVAEIVAIPWAQIRRIETSTVAAKIGSRTAQTIRIGLFDGTSALFAGEIELIVRGGSADADVEQLLARRRAQ